MIGYDPRPDKARKTKRKVSREGKRKAGLLTRTPFKFKFWKKS